MTWALVKDCTLPFAQNDNKELPDIGTSGTDPGVFEVQKSVEEVKDG